jgi:hypothetical protein
LANDLLWDTLKTIKAPCVGLCVRYEVKEDKFRDELKTVIGNKFLIVSKVEVGRYVIMKFTRIKEIANDLSDDKVNDYLNGKGTGTIIQMYIGNYEYFYAYDEWRRPMFDK